MLNELKVLLHTCTVRILQRMWMWWLRSLKTYSQQAGDWGELMEHFQPGLRLENQENQWCKFPSQSESKSRREPMSSLEKAGERILIYSAFLFYLGLQRTGWGQLTLRRAIGFAQSADSNTESVETFSQTLMSNQISEYPEVQSCWYIKLTDTHVHCIFRFPRPVLSPSRKEEHHSS